MAGDPAVIARFQAIRHQVLSRAREPEALRREVVGVLAKRAARIAYQRAKEKA